MEVVDVVATSLVQIKEGFGGSLTLTKHSDGFVRIQGVWDKKSNWEAGNAYAIIGSIPEGFRPAFGCGLDCGHVSDSFLNQSLCLWKDGDVTFDGISLKPANPDFYVHGCYLCEGEEDNSNIVKKWTVEFSSGFIGKNHGLHFMLCKDGFARVQGSFAKTENWSGNLVGEVCRLPDGDADYKPYHTCGFELACNCPHAYGLSLLVDTEGVVKIDAMCQPDKEVGENTTFRVLGEYRWKKMNAVSVEADFSESIGRGHLRFSYVHGDNLVRVVGKFDRSGQWGEGNSYGAIGELPESVRPATEVRVSVASTSVKMYHGTVIFKTNGEIKFDGIFSKDANPDMYISTEYYRKNIGSRVTQIEWKDGFQGEVSLEKNADGFVRVQGKWDRVSGKWPSGNPHALIGLIPEGFRPALDCGTDCGHTSTSFRNSSCVFLNDGRLMFDGISTAEMNPDFFIHAVYLAAREEHNDSIERTYEMEFTNGFIPKRQGLKFFLCKDGYCRFQGCFTRETEWDGNLYETIGNLPGNEYHPYFTSGFEMGSLDQDAWGMSMFVCGSGTVKIDAMMRPGKKGTPDSTVFYVFGLYRWKSNPGLTFADATLLEAFQHCSGRTLRFSRSENDNCLRIEGAFERGFVHFVVDSAHILFSDTGTANSTEWEAGNPYCPIGRIAEEYWPSREVRLPIATQSTKIYHGTLIVKTDGALHFDGLFESPANPDLFVSGVYTRDVEDDEEAGEEEPEAEQESEGEGAPTSLPAKPSHMIVGVEQVQWSGSFRGNVSLTKYGDGFVRIQGKWDVDGSWCEGNPNSEIGVIPEGFRPALSCGLDCGHVSDCFQNASLLLYADGRVIFDGISTTVKNPDFFVHGAYLAEGEESNAHIEKTHIIEFENGFMARREGLRFYLCDDGYARFQGCFTYPPDWTGSFVRKVASFPSDDFHPYTELGFECGSRDDATYHLSLMVSNGGLEMHGTCKEGCSTAENSCFFYVLGEYRWKTDEARVVEAVEVNAEMIEPVGSSGFKFYGSALHDLVHVEGKFKRKSGVWGAGNSYSRIGKVSEDWFPTNSVRIACASESTKTYHASLIIERDGIVKLDGNFSEDDNPIFSIAGVYKKFLGISSSSSVSSEETTTSESGSSSPEIESDRKSDAQVVENAVSQAEAALTLQRSEQEQLLEMLRATMEREAEEQRKASLELERARQVEEEEIRRLREADEAAALEAIERKRAEEEAARRAREVEAEAEQRKTALLLEQRERELAEIKARLAREQADREEADRRAKAASAKAVWGEVAALATVEKVESYSDDQLRKISSAACQRCTEIDGLLQGARWDEVVDIAKTVRQFLDKFAYHIIAREAGFKEGSDLSELTTGPGSVDCWKAAAQTRCVSPYESFREVFAIKAVLNVFKSLDHDFFEYAMRAQEAVLDLGCRLLEFHVMRASVFQLPIDQEGVQAIQAVVSKKKKFAQDWERSGKKISARLVRLLELVDEGLSNMRVIESGFGLEPFMKIGIGLLQIAAGAGTQNVGAIFSGVTGLLSGGLQLFKQGREMIRGKAHEQWYLSLLSLRQFYYTLIAGGTNPEEKMRILTELGAALEDFREQLADPRKARKNRHPNRTGLCFMMFSVLQDLKCANDPHINSFVMQHEGLLVSALQEFALRLKRRKGLFTKETPSIFRAIKDTFDFSPYLDPGTYLDIFESVADLVGDLLD